MSLTVNGSACSSAQELYGLCQASPLLHEASQIKATRYSSVSSIDHQGQRKIGTIDATSCLGLIYTTSKGERIVQHYDNREGEKFLKLFQSNAYREAGPLRVTIIGGCRNPNSSGEFTAEFSCLETHTKTNIEDLVQAWKRYCPMPVIVHNWLIGDANNNSTLCSDFVASPDGRTYLLQPGTAIAEGLVPEMPRRHVAQWIYQHEYICVYDDATHPNLLRVPNVSNKRFLTNLAAHINTFATDELLLQNLSTTPTLEPPHFVRGLRDCARFIHEEKNVSAMETPMDKEKPVIVLQGEYGRLI